MQANPLKTPKVAGDLVSLRLEPLQDALKAAGAGLTHPIEWVRSLHLTEVGCPEGAGRAEDVRFAVHVLHHEVLALEGKRRTFTCLATHLNCPFECELFATVKDGWAE